MVDVDARPDDVVRSIPTGLPRRRWSGCNRRTAFIASGCGFGSIAPTAPPVGPQLPGSRGVVSILDVSNHRDLARFTKQVHDNNDVLPPSTTSRQRDRDDTSETARTRTTTGIIMVLNPFQCTWAAADQTRLLHHQREPYYDQVSATCRRATAILAAGVRARVTPNHHALADQFALLDNYYGPGDRSLGHRWVLQSTRARGCTSGNARNNQNPCCSGRPTRSTTTPSCRGSACGHAKRRQYDHSLERDLDRHLQ